MTDIFDIHNPTQSRRVIYDGLKNKEIVIEPGDTKKSVPLAEYIVKSLRNRVDDLTITEIKSAAVEQKPKPVPFTPVEDDPSKMIPVPSPAPQQPKLTLPAQKYR